jgi:hypothetical protein
MEGALYTTTTTSPGTSAFMSFLNSWRLSVDLPEAFPINFVAFGGLQRFHLRLIVL